MGFGSTKNIGRKGSFKKSFIYPPNSYELTGVNNSTTNARRFNNIVSSNTFADPLFLMSSGAYDWTILVKDFFIKEQSYNWSTGSFKSVFEIVSTSTNYRKVLNSVEGSSSCDSENDNILTRSKILRSGTITSTTILRVNIGVEDKPTVTTNCGFQSNTKLILILSRAPISINEGFPRFTYKKIA